ncbi:DUF2268 domain-containing putative Zn-dependent protease [Flavobacterium sp. NRK1]|uniref:DUF2268 domain-containing putative Zn-dependent protease n=1 Tax=Flavobacterium sp. NRK1 TaxID=2954929 RepID=UPI0020939AAF|nr:DUF2268 domain-containing putative Zn-dependent protease [Flavobacterium sp. NRK1]MCO6149627.1 DUF2268 domain-containing protein [Flavobacterium sp. NRK1]
MIKKALSVVLLFISFICTCQVKVYTSDIDNYWEAYDSIINTHDFAKRLDLINRLYINKGTKGLKAFMQARRYKDTLFVKHIEVYPKFWNSIRANTIAVKSKTNEIQKAIAKLKILYPLLKPAELYFTIGGFRSAGTISGNMVLVGCEIATGTPDIDMSEFENKWLAGVFAQQDKDHIVPLTIHEYIHTQQKKAILKNVLAFSVSEGSADFITELVMGKPLVTSYLTYGREHATTIKKSFRKEMFATSIERWLFNGSYLEKEGDMGYYIGYEICKAYYNNSTDKMKAVKDIIELNYSSETALEKFLEKSGFYNEHINREQTIKAYNESLPYIVSYGPFKNGDKNVNSGSNEFKITFSKPMDPENFSLYYTNKGKDYFPLKKLLRMEDDNKTFVFETDLMAGHDYEFIVSNEEFSTPDRFKISNKSFKIKFSTEPLRLPK